MMCLGGIFVPSLQWVYAYRLQLLSKTYLVRSLCSLGEERIIVLCEENALKGTLFALVE